MDSEKGYSREEVKDHYEGHSIDIDTARDRFTILEGPAEDVRTTFGDSTDKDTKAVLEKTQENPNDPYNND